MYNNKTFIHDLSGNNLYMGNFKPSGGLTAHQRLGNSFGLEQGNFIGGYFNSQGQPVYNSGTFNTPQIGARNLGSLPMALGDPFQGSIVHYANHVPWRYGG